DGADAARVLETAVSLKSSDVLGLQRGEFADALQDGLGFPDPEVGEGGCAAHRIGGEARRMEERACAILGIVRLEDAGRRKCCGERNGAACEALGEAED